MVKGEDERMESSDTEGQKEAVNVGSMSGVSSSAVISGSSSAHSLQLFPPGCWRGG